MSSYTVVSVNGSKVQALSTHPTRKDALRAMQRVSGSITAVRAPGGRIIAHNISRSI